MLRYVGRADQRVEIAVRDHEDDATVVVLQDEGMIAVVELRQENVAATNQPDEVARRLAEALVQHVLHPRARRVHKHFRLNLFTAREAYAPIIALALRRADFGTRQHPPATRANIERIRKHQASVIHPAIGVDEAVLELRLESGRVRRRIEPHGVRAGQ